MNRPMKAPLVAGETDGDLELRNPRDGSVHRLNAVAGLVWDLCDGSRSESAIAREVADLFGKAPEEVAADVAEVLVRLGERGLIRSADGGHRERRLLLACAASAIGNGRPGAGEGPDDGIDWAYLLETALQHGVAPLLHRGLGALPIAAPAWLLTRLEAHVEASRTHNERLAGELVEVLASFAAHGIPAVSLKGPLLAVSAYEDLALRQFGDLDLFVRPEHARRAKDLLTSRGYRFVVSAETDARAELEGESPGVTVDLQWALAPRRFRFPVRLDDLLDRLKPYSWGTSVVFQPAPADYLLILCAHGAKHCWSRLAWIADVAAFTRTHGRTLDWGQLLALASVTGGERMLLVGLQLAIDLLGADVPDAIAGRIRADPPVGSLASELRGRLFTEVTAPDFQGSYGFYEGGLLFIRSRERVRDKVPLALHLLHRPFRPITNLVLPHQDDRAWVALPKSLAVLYFAIRPVRLAWKHGGRLVRRRRNRVTGQ